MKYFAYGSNLYWPRMKARVPSARFCAVGKLNGHVLEFHKKGADGSAKCNAYPTGRLVDEMYGVVFDIHASERSILDDIEGLGRGYDDTQIEVITDTATLEAFTYTAQPDFIDDTLKPLLWYKRYVVEGARQHALPVSYVRMLEVIEAVPDRDEQQARQHADILGN